MHAADLCTNVFKRNHYISPRWVWVFAVDQSEERGESGVGERKINHQRSKNTFHLEKISDHFDSTDRVSALSPLPTEGSRSQELTTLDYIPYKMVTNIYIYDLQPLLIDQFHKQRLVK